MATQQPSLEAKKAYFEHFQTLPFSDDEEEERYKTGETATAAPGLDPDGLDPSELRMRHRHRRFFQQKSPANKVSATADASQNQISGQMYERETKDDDAVVQSTPNDKDDNDDDVVVVSSSARATPQGKPAHPRGGSKRQRNAVDDALAEGFTQVVGETPVNMVRRQQQRRGTSVKTDAKTATPVPLAKRLMVASASKSALSLSASPALSQISAVAGATTAAKKRKKDSQTTLRPESEQIFKGLLFYYIPDNDIAPARRLRMQKAREYGATRTSDALQATHVIVDRDIGYQDAENVLHSQGRRVEMGAAAVVVVNEDYPIECVQFRALLDARQKRYRLNGQPDEVDGDAAETQAVAGAEATEQETSSAAKGQDADNADKATKGHGWEGLKLKEPQRNPRKWDCVPRSTPKSSDGSGTASPAAVAEVESQPIALDGAAAPGDIREDTPPAEKKKKEKEDKSAAPGDELTTFIDMLQEFKDLPLDNDEEEETATSPTANDSEESDLDEERQNQQRAAATAVKKKADTATTVTTTTSSPKGPERALADRFACSRAGGLADHAASPNSRTVEILARMQSYYERTSDPWRTMAYRKAISTLKRQPHRITTHAEAVRLPGVGPRLAAKIEEIATTDRLARLEYAEQDADGADAVLKLFLGVYGVGPALAGQWMARGLRTLDDVVNSAAGTGGVRLTAAQRMGIARYEDLNTKIPREEVEALGRVVQARAKEVDADVELTIGGSFRRGAKESSDIDFIVSKPGTESEVQLRPFLKELVARLQEDKFLVATLAADGNIWHGCCVLPDGGQDVWRRIDFLLVPASQMGAALIYFTGDDVFNRSIRLLAQKKGMKLNQRGLYKRPGGGGGGGSWGEMRNVVVTEEDLIEGKDERRIFEILGVKWREPTQRWC